MKKLIPIFILFFAFSGFAQEKPKANLVDEFGSITCEDFLARTDNFTYRLNHDRTSDGFVIFRGNSEYLKKLLTMTFNVWLGKNIHARVVESLGGEKGGEFWLVPRGATPPTVTDGRFAAVYPNTYNATFLFSHEGEGPCTFNTLPAFVQLLRLKPELRGKIVLHGPANELQQSIAFHVNQLTSSDRRHIKVFYRTENVPYTEFWIIPIKKK